MQQPKIVEISQKKLLGHSIDMSLIQNKTFELFSGFMPKRKEILNSVDTDIYEVMVYDNLYFKDFNPNNVFIKWACVEVSNFECFPKDMKPLQIDPSLYAKFTYKGLAKDFGMFMRYVLTDWLPQSKFLLDDRPHFNILGKAYKKDDPNSLEDVYIPIKEKI